MSDPVKPDPPKKPSLPPRPAPKAGAKPPPPVPTKPPRAKEDSTLELLPLEEDEGESEAAPQPTAPPPVIPPPTPSNAETLELKKFESPLGPRRNPWLEDFRAWATKDKPKWFVPAISGGALGALVLALVIGKVACGPRASATATTTASATASVHPTITAPPPPPMTCALAGERRSIAPRALAASGVEVAALGSEIAVGFASSPNDGKLEILDPTTGATTTSVLARSNDPIRRVLALSRTSADLDVDRKGDALHSRRTVLGDPPVDVGGMADGFGWAPRSSDKPTKLWDLPQGHVAVEQVRGDALPDGKGFAVAFRQGSVVYAGAFGGTPPSPLGPLVHVDGLGTTGGAPVIAASGDRIMIAWSDRATPTEPWHVRTATFRVGEGEAQPHAFAAPPGGLGEQTMSPDLTSLGEGRFLLLWTEGTTTHQVRAAVLNGEGAPSSAFAVSPDGIDAGQGQSAVLEDGRGAVAYLSTTSPGFYEAIVAPLKCAERR